MQTNMDSGNAASAISSPDLSPMRIQTMLKKEFADDIEVFIYF